VKKLERFLFYFLLFTIPFQTRKILWHQNWNFNEWQAISLYGTDILLIILFGFWIFSRVKLKVEKYDYFLFALVAVSAISIKNSSSYVLSAYNVLKLIEFVAFYLYIKSYAVKKFGLMESMIVLFCGGLFQAIIAIGQFFKQSSLGLRYFGESVLVLGDISKTDGLSTLVAEIQAETARDPIAIITEKIINGKQFLTDFVSARITAIRGYFDEVYANVFNAKEKICIGQTC
jgi:hypothetical protein